MDPATLAALRSAFSATPSNMQLLRVLLGAYLERGEPEQARELIEAAKFDGKPDAETSLVIARVLSALDRKSEALEAYRNAVRENPTLEDVDLEARLGARVREVQFAAGRPRLKVISNDDTD